MVVALTIVWSLLLTSDALGAAGVGRPKKAAPPDPKTQRFLNLSGNGLRLAPFKKARLIPVGSVENERTFSVINFIKDDRRNRLEPEHLNCCLRMKRSRFTLDTFPLEAALSVWGELKDRRGDLD